MANNWLRRFAPMQVARGARVPITQAEARRQLINLLRAHADKNRKPPPPHLEIRPSSVCAGLGVFALRPIAPGEVCTIYPGLRYALGQDPVLLASIGNQFVLRCLSGDYLDGRPHGTFINEMD